MLCDVVGVEVVVVVVVVLYLHAKVPWELASLVYSAISGSALKIPVVHT